MIAAIAISLFTSANVVHAEPEPTADIGATYFTFGVGAYRPDSSAQFANQSGQYGVAFGLGYRATRTLAWEVEFIDAYQRLDTPASLSAPASGNWDPRASLHMEGIAATLKYIFSHGRIEPYAGAGIGWYRSSFSTTSSGTAGSYARDEDSDDFGVHLSAGVDYYVAEQHAFGVEFRSLRVNAHFPQSGLTGTVHAGGNFLLLKYRVAF